MAWFKVDDGFHDHPKVDDLSLEAIGLWLMCATWSSRHLTDGVVPVSRIVKLGGNAELCSELVRANMWRTSEDVRDDGSPNAYEYVNWGDWNPTKDDVKLSEKRLGSACKISAPSSLTRGNVRANKRRTNRELRKMFVTPSRPVPSSLMRRLRHPRAPVASDQQHHCRTAGFPTSLTAIKPSSSDSTLTNRSNDSATTRKPTIADKHPGMPHSPTGSCSRANTSARAVASPKTPTPTCGAEP